MAKPLKPIKPAPMKTLEEVLPALRKGKPIRRLAWHPQSLIFRLGKDVFVKLPSQYERSPSLWKPYPQDFLASDWAVAK